jgi:hypothetical protein
MGTKTALGEQRRKSENDRSVDPAHTIKHLVGGGSLDAPRQPPLQGFLKVTAAPSDRSSPRRSRREPSAEEIADFDPGSRPS